MATYIGILSYLVEWNEKMNLTGITEVMMYT